jgi:leucyl aminopeptidase
MSRDLPMPDRLQIKFAALDAGLEAVAVVLATDGVALTGRAQALERRLGGQISRAAMAASFKGKRKSSFELLAAEGTDVQRLIVAGLGNVSEMKEEDWVETGGTILGLVTQRKATAASLVAEWPASDAADAAAHAAALAFGALLRSYEFKKYRAGKKDEEDNGASTGEGNSAGKDKLATLIVHCADPAGATAAFTGHAALAEGIFLARNLVNEPANELGPVEFAEQAKALEKAGVEVEILEAEQLEQIGMRALLGVAQGSARPARVAILHWHGAAGRRSAKPVCFIGKGVVFDTGGISIKPAAGMEDMKGDMGGAACVTGLMLALAGRKAKVNAVGLVGLVENMPSATAQRPGDIVRSLSGQTVEIVNTDAEGRLVLCDLLWYAQDRFKPRFMIDLATLTGAIMVALGKEHAGLFSNDDKLSAQLVKAGEAVGEKVWRMPMGKAYDKMIDSRFADMKNTGGRYGGSITAAQFLLRFVRSGTPWAHLDIAGTAMDSPRSEISTSWASGWGVRLLDRLVAEHYE